MTYIRQNGEILVRPLVDVDAPLLYRAVIDSIESLSYWLPWCHPGYSPSDAEAWVAHSISAWENQNEFPLGIFSDQSGELLGSVGLSQVNRANRCANLGYWVSQRHRGKGVATRAVSLAASIGFEDLGLVRLEIVTLLHNHASQRVAEKLGATREVEARNRLLFQGQPAVGIVYSLIPGDMAINAPLGPRPATGSTQ